MSAVQRFIRIPLAVTVTLSTAWCGAATAFENGPPPGHTGALGVQSVGHTTRLLLSLDYDSAPLEVEGIDPPPGANDHIIDYSAIDDDFLATVGIGLVAGRGFDATDVVDGGPVALVNEEFVRRFFPQGDALGRTLRINDEETQVVGVTRNTKVRTIGEAQRRDRTPGSPGQTRQ